jgi:hypothetical protein
MQGLGDAACLLALHAGCCQHYTTALIPHNVLESTTPLNMPLHGPPHLLCCPPHLSADHNAPSFLLLALGLLAGAVWQERFHGAALKLIAMFRMDHNTPICHEHPHLLCCLSTHKLKTLHPLFCCWNWICLQVLCGRSGFTGPH